MTSAIVRGYREEDFDALAALINSQSEDPAITRFGLRSLLSMPGYQPEADLCVAPAPGGNQLLGARDVRVTGRGDEATLILESWGAVHRGTAAGIVGVLLRATIARSARLLTERGRGRGVLQARCGADDLITRAAFEAGGLVYARDLVSMLRRSLGDIAEPCFPPGVVLRTYRVGADDDAWVHAFNEAFADHWGGFMGMSPALWAHYVGEPVFKPEISLVASTGSKLIGFCHCRIDDELNALTGRQLGVIRYVGVVPGWRRRGLGAALTLAGLRALRDAGTESAALGVDAENVTGAHRLYQRYGFEIVDRQVLYRVGVVGEVATR
jgi:mycothiol synthase